ncbi:MAG: Tk-subtilisin precursor [Candidatus Methanolliviera sp. GoM_oil]|nr:MAG: Tk-subtilisin precursor [Candidatus Methanolliviera sp. GoM_oil]
MNPDLQRRNNTRYVVEVDELSPEMLMNLKKNSRIIHIFSLIDNIIAIETDNIEGIKELKGVSRVRESGKAKLMLTEALNTIGIPDVHDRGFYGDGVWVGVVDSGIDMSDPLVSGSMVLERDFTDEGMYDPIGHGTIMARILKGVAPNISFINAKVVDRSGEADEIDIMRSIEWCVNSDVDVINISLGISRTCDGSCPLCELVNVAAESAITVAAAGNNGPDEGSISCPANSESCIAVGSMGRDGAVSNYSSRGAPGHLKPDIVAPGCIKYGDFKLEGTSIATPFVSASAALLLSMGDYDRRQVVATIFGTADDKGFPRWVQGHGLIRADKAVEAMLCD